MELKTFYTVVVLKAGMFETTIADERHFATQEQAKAWANSQSNDLVSVIIEL